MSNRPTHTADANVWAYQFCQQNPAVREDTMLYWFQDALKCGLDAGRAEAGAKGVPAGANTATEKLINP